MPSEFFLEANYKTTSGCFVKKIPIGENSFRHYFMEVTKSCNVKGVGFRDYPTLHSLRGTLISKLQRLDHIESQIVQSTWHKSIASINSYTTTLGLEGEMQQNHVFAKENLNKRQKHESPEPSDAKPSSPVFNSSNANISSAVVGNMHSS